MDSRQPNKDSHLLDQAKRRTCTIQFSIILCSALVIASGSISFLTWFNHLPQPPIVILTPVILATYTSSDTLMDDPSPTITLQPTLTLILPTPLQLQTITPVPTHTAIQ